MEVNDLDFKNVQKVSFNGTHGVKEEQISPQTRVIYQTKPDEFVKQTPKKDKVTDPTKDGKFSFWQAAKNLGKGLISPITVIFKHPVATLATLAGIGAACFMFPVLTPIITIGFAGLSVFQLGKALYQTGKNIANGNYDQAEKKFEDIGSSAVATALSFIGIKQGARVAMEAKAAAQVGAAGLNAAQRTEIATQVKAMSYKDACKEIASLFTSKDGYKTIGNQFKPGNIKERLSIFKKMKENYKNNNENRINKANAEDISRKIEEFKKSPEGIRRAAMTDEQIQAEVNAKFNQAFDELGIPKEQRPKLEIKKGEAREGGFYSQKEHTITYNPESYKSGYFELDDVMMHEATHCKEALLRAGLPKDKINEIIIDDLSQRIINGEAEEILVKGNICGPVMMKSPKLPNNMRQDFLQFAKKYLFNNDEIMTKNIRTQEFLKSQIEFCERQIAEATKNGNSKEIAEYTSRISEYSKQLKTVETSLSPYLKDIETMVQKYPEYVSQYKTPEEALTAIQKYALSHKNRFEAFSNTQIEGITPSKLTPQQIKLAEQSLKGQIDTIEGNAGISGFNGIFANQKQFNHYQFSPEEVLAQQNGNNFLIRNYKAQLAEMRANGTLTPEKEAFLTSQISKAEATIAYKTKGLEFYKLYTRMINNPEDKALAEAVNAMKIEMEQLAAKMNGYELKEINEILNLKFSIPKAFLPEVYIMTEKQAG